MSETNDNITDQQNDGPRTTDVTNELPVRADADYAPDRFVLPPPTTNSLWSCVVVGGLLLCLLILGVGLLIPAVERVKTASTHTQSLNNVKQMVLAVNNIAANTTTGDIPPAYGPYPAGSTTNQSFFVSLLPFIEQQNLYVNWTSNSTTKVKSYIASTDPNNPDMNGLISYGSNATLLTVGGSPTMPRSFNGRTSSIIVVFERTAKSGATWSSSNSYLIDSNGSSSPEFGSPASWSSYGSRATALTSAGCIVGMGDGSARVVTQSNANAGWAWAMNPQDPTDQPRGW